MTITDTFLYLIVPMKPVGFLCTFAEILINAYEKLYSHIPLF